MAFRKHFFGGLSFIRKNPSIVSSLFLIVVVVGVIFGNSYYSLGKFQEATDALMQSKAVLAERIFETLASDIFDSSEALSGRLDTLKRGNPDVSGILVLGKPGESGFPVLASTDSEDIGKAWDEPTYSIAWSQEEEVAFLSNDRGERFWNVIRQVRNGDGDKVGLVLFQLSLRAHDSFISAEMRKVYAVAGTSLFFVILLLANHLRFFGYVARTAKLEELDRMKDDFISMASHELKSPIAILKGYADILKTADDVDRERYIGNMETTLDRLSTLVEDLLVVSRIEQNRLPVDIREIRITDVLGELAEDFSLLAKEKGLGFSYLPKDTAAEVLADPERAKQILVNLLSNAVKYTGSGKVELSFETLGKEIVVTVADTGMGISAADMEKLFGKFFRIRNAETEKISGTGLGLWIAREIARKMGGDLTVESIRGVGSHFKLHLRKSEDS